MRLHRFFQTLFLFSVLGSQAQLNTCRLEALSTDSFQRISLTQLQQHNNEWYGPAAYTRKVNGEGMTRWTLLQLSEGNVAPLTDTSYYHVIDYRIEEQYLLVAGKRDTGTAPNLRPVITLSVFQIPNLHPQAIRLITPHYFAFDIKGYLAVTDTNHQRFYTTLLKSGAFEDLHLYHPNGSPAGGSINKLFPILRDGTAQYLDTIGRYGLLLFDTMGRRMVTTSLAGLAAMIPNHNGTWWIQSSEGNRLVRRQADGNLFLSPPYGTLNNFIYPYAYTLGTRGDSLFAINEDLEEFFLLTTPHPTQIQMSYFEGAEHAFLLQKANRDSIHYRIYETTEGLPQVRREFYSTLSLQPLAYLSKRYFFWHRQGDSVIMHRYSPLQKKLLNLKVFLQPEARDNSRIFFVASRPDAFLWLNSKSAAVFTYSTDSDTLTRFTLSSTLSDWHISTDRSMLALREERSTDPVSNQKKVTWRAIDLTLYDRKTKAPLEGTTFEALYAFTTLKAPCGTTTYFSAVPKAGERERVFRFKHLPPPPQVKNLNRKK